MKKLLFLFGLIFAVFILSIEAVLAEVPNEIRYNGKIKEYRQEVTGTRSINFRIYDALTAGNQEWQSGPQSVQISSGIFSVILCPTIDWRKKDYYIEMEVNSKVLSPREKLTAVPYSLHSGTSEGGKVTATGEYSITIGSDKRLIVNSSGVKEVKGTTEYYMVPKGGIIIWSGAANEIPDGWVLCDGNNGTPDLRGRFVLGAVESTGATYSAGNTGGEESHTLTIAEMPRHNHSLSYASNGAGGGGAGPNNSGTIYTSYEGGNQAHNNMPPYYTLCFIMKQ